MSGAHIPDLAERRRALDPPQSFIVQAPAGSGKTELLIQRYLLLLAHVDHPEEVTAVTFTRKAAGEMRERVLAALAAAQAGTSPASEHEQQTLDLAAAALRRDITCGWHLADNPARLRILTIDALCASLTRQMPMLSGFGSQPENIEDATELYREAARATIDLVEGDDAVAQDMARLLAHLDNNVARIENLLIGMLRRRDHWLRNVHGPERNELEASLLNARQVAHLRVRELMPEALRPELVSLAEFTFKNIGLQHYADTIEGWIALAAVLLTSKGGWRKRLTKTEGFPTGKAAQPWKVRGLALLDGLAGHEQLRVAINDMRSIPPERYSDDQWEVLGAILRLLPLAVGQLKLVFQSRGQVDFTEVSQAALRALVNDEGPTDLALALDYRIRHLLIDEFQDTSISQYELVARLTAGWNPGDGRTVFAVGDPMQSIYRFREAEVGLFLRARASGIADIKLQRIALSANFRSQAHIVDWVNAAFSGMMPAHEDAALGAVPYAASMATRAPLTGEAVSVHAFFNGDRAAEASRVLEIVMQARREDAQIRIAILVRTRGHLREIVPLLKEAGLRFRAIDIEELGHRPVVQDLLALTRALAHPADRLAWLAVLRAPWSGLTLGDLHALAAHDHVRTVWELMDDAACVAALSSEGSARAQRVHAVLKTCLDNRCREPLRDRIAGAWLALGGPACVESATDLEDARIYFDYLDKHDEAGEIPDLTAFEEGLAKLYALPDLQADDTLQIMTIHKAKGLEFDVVIVPGLGRTTRSDDARLFLWTEQPGRNGNHINQLLLAPIKETGQSDDAIYAWLQKLEAEKADYEVERLLYVAATRARQRLHLLGDTKLALGKDGEPEVKPPARNTLLGKLWPAIEPVYADAARRAREVAPSPSLDSGVLDTQVIDQRLRRLVSGWQLPEAPAGASWAAPQDTTRVQDDIEFSWVGETARHVGSVVHRWLQRIADDALSGWDDKRIAGLRGAFRESLAARGIPENELDAATNRVSAALVHAVTDTRGRWLLGPQHETWNERRITAVISGQRVNLAIDRMFRDADGKQWIIDYKTSSHEGADVAAFIDRERVRYQAQLERYALAMGGLTRPTLALYFPLLEGWREW